VPAWLQERIDSLGAEVDHSERAGTLDSKGVLAAVDTHSKTTKNRRATDSRAYGNSRSVAPLRRDEINAALKAALEDRRVSSPDMQAVRNALPIASLRNELLTTLDQSPVVVVSGGTGSGKTTQIPQYILDGAIESGRGCDVNVSTNAPLSLHHPPPPSLPHLPHVLLIHSHVHTHPTTTDPRLGACDSTTSYCGDVCGSSRR
jgi:hypothetical protein